MASSREKDVEEHVIIHEDGSVTLGILTDEFTEHVSELLKEMPEYLRKNNLSVTLEFDEFDELNDYEYHPSLLSMCLTAYYYTIKHPELAREPERRQRLEFSALLGNLVHHLMQAYLQERMGGHVELAVKDEFWPGWTLKGHVDFVSDDYTKIIEIKTVKNSFSLKFVPYRRR